MRKPAETSISIIRSFTCISWRATSGRVDRFSCSFMSLKCQMKASKTLDGVSEHPHMDKPTKILLLGDHQRFYQKSGVFFHPPPPCRLFEKMDPNRGKLHLNINSAVKSTMVTVPEHIRRGVLIKQ